MKTPSNKITAFRSYLLQRNPSLEFANKYITYLRSSLVRLTVQKVCNNNDIFIDDIDDLEVLQKIYNELKKNSKNQSLHNVYSGAVSAYIKFLTGKPLRAMVKGKELSHDDE